jgi:hypothetical protein
MGTPPPLLIATPVDTSSTMALSPSKEKGPSKAISQIIEAIRDMEDGKAFLPPWYEFPLNADQYAEFVVEIEKDSVFGYYKDKIRYVLSCWGIHC